MAKAKAPKAASREQRHLTAEFKLEAVRRAEERRAAGLPLTQVARELGVTDDLLRRWRRHSALGYVSHMQYERQLGRVARAA